LLKDIDGAKTVEQVTEQILEVLRQAH